MVVATMNDPFYGLVYARGFPQSCRSDSEGQRRVKLKVKVEDCGVKVVEDEVSGTVIWVLCHCGVLCPRGKRNCRLCCA